MSAIILKTEIPGPKSQDLLNRRAAAVSAALYQSVPVAVARASGSLIDGLLDFNAVERWERVFGYPCGK